MIVELLINSVGKNIKNVQRKEKFRFPEVFLEETDAVSQKMNPKSRNYQSFYAVSVKVSIDFVFWNVENSTRKSLLFSSLREEMSPGFRRKLPKIDAESDKKSNFPGFSKILCKSKNQKTITSSYFATCL